MSRVSSRKGVRCAPHRRAPPGRAGLLRGRRPRRRRLPGGWARAGPAPRAGGARRGPHGCGQGRATATAGARRWARARANGEREGDAKSAGESEAEAIGRAVAEAAGHEVVVHDRFGTVTLKAEPESIIDLATLRREAYARPGALPEVATGHPGGGSPSSGLQRQRHGDPAERCRAGRGVGADRSRRTDAPISRRGPCACSTTAASTMIRPARCVPRVWRRAWASDSRAAPASCCAMPCATASSAPSAVIACAARSRSSSRTRGAA